MEDGRTKNLEEIAVDSEERFFLFDTCALIGPLGKGIRDLECERVKDKTHILQKNEYFMREIRNYLETGKNFLVTDLVLEEFDDFKHYSYGESVKKPNGAIDRRLLLLRKKIKDQEMEKEKLVKSLRESESVLNLSGKPEEIYYNYLSGRYKDIAYNYNLSGPDFDFVLTGVSLALSNKNAALVSNDYQSMHAWNEIVIEENIDEQNLNFFTRVDFFNFEKKSVRL